MACGIDEEETAVDTGVLDVAVSHRGKFFAEVGGVLVLFSRFEGEVSRGRDESGGRMRGTLMYLMMGSQLESER